MWLHGQPILVLHNLVSENVLVTLRYERRKKSKKVCAMIDIKEASDNVHRNTFIQTLQDP